MHGGQWFPARRSGVVVESACRRPLGVRPLMTRVLTPILHILMHILDNRPARISRSSLHT